MSDHFETQKLLQKLMRLQWLLQRQQQVHSGHGPFADPTRGQGRVLALLKMQPEISTRDLSYLLDIRQQSLSELLGKLEKAEYITRTPLESDRRVMLVRLTEKGKEAKQEMPDRGSLFDCLTPEEQAEFGGYLDRVIANVEDSLGIDEKKNMERWMKHAHTQMNDDMYAHLMEMRGRAACRDERRGRRGERGARRDRRTDDPNER